jgi:hypothetical protein
MISIKNIEKNSTPLSEEETVTRTVPQPTRRRRGFAGKLSGLLFIAVVILACLYIQQKREVTRLTDPVAQTEYAQKQVDKVIADLKNYMVIPDDEDLKLLGVINDAESLKKDQAFYANVEKGDYVFLFAKSSRALIWRPTDKKIVNFGVANTVPSQDSAAVQPKPTTPPATTTPKKTTETEQ